MKPDDKTIACTVFTPDSASVAVPYARIGSSMALAIALLLNACATPNPNERVTGDGGGHLVKLSSKQTTVDLTEQEQANLRQMQDKLFANLDTPTALQASADALTNMGFKPVKVDKDILIVEGQQDKVLGDHWHKVIRAIFKAKGIPLHAKPDHESINAMIAIHSDAANPGILVRARFTATVWDSNGDSKTTTVIDHDVYDKFFTQMTAPTPANSVQTVTGQPG